MAKVLLVEDDNNLREIYEARLQAEGYTIVSANDGEAALVVAKNEKPDLVISDVMMPKISGFEMLDILRNTPGLEDVKVIMLTALGQADDQARAGKLGADRYLVKSQVTLEDIVKVSHELIDGNAAPAAAPATDAPAAAAPAADTPAPTEPAAPTQIAVATAPAEPAASTDNSAQTSASEEADVEKQIDDFVTNQPAEAPPAVEPDPTPEPAPAPEVTTPETTAATDQQVLDNAVETIVGSGNAEAAQAGAPATAPTPEPVVEPTPAAESAADTTPPVEPKAKTGGERVIQPLDSEPKKSLDELVAQEEAQEAASAPPVPVIGSASEDEKPSGAPAPSPSEQAAAVDPTKPVDPNSIAL